MNQTRRQLEVHVPSARFGRPLQFVLPFGRSLALHAPRDDRHSADLLLALAGRLPLPQGALSWRGGDVRADAAELRALSAYAAHDSPLPPLDACTLHKVQQQFRADAEPLEPWLERLALRGHEHTPWPRLPLRAQAGLRAALALASGAKLTLLDQPQELAPTLRALWPDLLQEFALAGRSLLLRTRSRELAQLADEVLDFGLPAAALLGPPDARLQVRRGLAALQFAWHAHPQIRQLHATPQPIPRDGGELMLWLQPSTEASSSAKRLSELLSRTLAHAEVELESLSTRLTR